MTIFTRAMIDPRHRLAMRALASLERMHAITARATDGDTDLSRVLWRLDPGRTRQPSRLYIVSPNVPDAEILRQELGVGTADISTCSYEPFLSRLECGQEWGFRLKANPTHSEPSGEPGKRGKRTGIIRVEEQQEWLFHQARRAGFHMPINRLELPEVLVRHSVQEKFRRKGSTVTLTSATYDGVLVVDDPDLLRRSLIGGIGRAKGYGFGLLTLVPLADDHRKEPRS